MSPSDETNDQNEADRRERQQLIRRSRPVMGGVVPRRPRPVKAPLDEGPSEEDIERFNSVTVRCKHCGAELFDDVQLCYQCGAAVLGDSRARLPVWAMVTGAVLIAAAVFFAFGPLVWRGIF